MENITLLKIQKHYRKTVHYSSYSDLCKLFPQLKILAHTTLDVPQLETQGNGGYLLAVDKETIILRNNTSNEKTK